MRVTICDVAPRDGLQNDPTTLEPGTRAELVNRLAAAGVQRIETVSFVNPARVPQMAGAEEVVAAIERAPGVVYAGLALNERGYDRLLATGLDEVHFAFAATETFNQRNQNASVEESLAAAERIVERAHADGIRATVTIGASFGCPFEGAGRSGPRRSSSRRGSPVRARTRSSSPTRSASACRGRCRHLVGEGLGLGVPIGVHLHNTRNTGIANALGRGRGGRDRARRVGRRDRRLPVRAAGDRQHQHRGSRLPPPRRGRRDGDRPRRADRGGRMARGRPRAATSRTGLPGRGASRRSPAKEENEWPTGSAWTSGGTFTDLLLVHDETGDLHRVKTPSTPADPAEGVLVGVRRICEESGVPPEELAYVMHGTTVATNALLEAKGARVGPDHHEGLQADPPPRALADAGAARGLDHHDQARPAGRARGHARGERAHGRPGRGRRAGRPGAGRGDRPRPRRLGRRVAHRLADQLVRERGPRARDQGDHPHAPSGLPGHDLVRGAAGVPRVRADADRVHELVRAPEGRGLRLEPRRARSTSSASRAT